MEWLADVENWPKQTNGLIGQPRDCQNTKYERVYNYALCDERPIKERFKESFETSPKQQSKD